MTGIKVFSPSNGLCDVASGHSDGFGSDEWPVMTSLLKNGVRAATFEFLKAVHPGDVGFLELRAFGVGAAAPLFVPLPLAETSMSAVQSYARDADRARRNLYHAIATRQTATSGRLENCGDLWALYIEIDFKHQVPLKDIWSNLVSFELTPSFIVHSGGGLHVYWLLAAPLDLRTDLGSARAYQWLGDLAQRLHGEPESTEPARVLRVPDTHNLKAAYGPVPRTVTVIAANPDLRYTIDQIAHVLGDTDPTTPVVSILTSQGALAHGLDVAQRIRLARKWLERQSTATEGQRGDAVTYRVCCDCVIGHDLTENDAMTALQDWNARCSPPWSAGGLRQKVRNALRYGKGQRGAKLATFPLTEAGDAECFAELYANTARYDHRQGRWLLASESGIWEPDPVERLHQLCVDMMRARSERAGLLIDSKEREKHQRWAHHGESRRRISNALALAQAVPPLNDRGDGWDADPMLLGLLNGVLDLRTGALRPARPDDRITRRARVPYDKAAKCPLWERAIGDVFANDASLVAFIQRAVGYSISGDCSEECFFLNWGHGANGKGTIMNTIAWLLGDYADNLSFSALELHAHSGGASPEVAKLVGKRFVTASETSEVRLNEARVKALTGRDPMAARFLYHDEFTFQPVAKFWLATNTLPVVRDNSDGFWRRVHLIPFTQSFVGNEDKTLKDRLRDGAEAAGILAWAVQGCLLWQRDGLNPPDAVTAATRGYRHDSDQLSRWIDAHCEVRDDGQLQAGPAFRDYQEWCDRQHEQPKLNQKRFGQEMLTRYKPGPNSRHTVYTGIALRGHQGSL